MKHQRLGLLIVAYVALLVSLTPSGIPASPHYWQKVCNAPFSPRDTAEAVVFDGAMWLSNGYHVGGDFSQDLWRSRDGLFWQEVLDPTPYDPYSQIVAFGGLLWAVSGSVWVSEDGVIWDCLVEHTPFGELHYADLVVFQNAMWLLGRGDQVWTTSDGIHWASTTAPYGNRYAPAIAVYQDRLYLMGGALVQSSDPPQKGYPEYTACNDVWTTSNGQDWVRLPDAPWSPRMWSQAAVWENRLWIVGGFQNQSASNSDQCWHTTNGITWTQFEDTAYWQARHEPAVYVFEGCLWVVAGNTNDDPYPLKNDVWKLPITGNGMPQVGMA